MEKWWGQNFLFKKKLF
uniref:Uncharacterized protein n=1 Tax=Arundo donax TaxID=35708 RepID=A0A0A8XXK5_ARUDO